MGGIDNDELVGISEACASVEALEVGSYEADKAKLVLIIFSCGFNSDKKGRIRNFCFGCKQKKTSKLEFF